MPGIQQLLPSPKIITHGANMGAGGRSRTNDNDVALALSVFLDDNGISCLR
jgi:hypothetical protein